MKSKQKAKFKKGDLVRVKLNCDNVAAACLDVGATFVVGYIRYYNDNGGLKCHHAEHCFYVYGLREHNIPQDALELAREPDFIEDLPLVGVTV